jgi:hypothetical protein
MNVTTMTVRGWLDIFKPMIYLTERISFTLLHGSTISFFSLLNTGILMTETRYIIFILDSNLKTIYSGD